MSPTSPTTKSQAASSSDAPPAVQFDPTPPLGQDVLTLFRGPFADVRFPDVDRDSLEADARALLARQADVESLEAALEEARQHTKDAAAQLVTSAGRALAYAKVFAMGQPELEAALNQVRAVPGAASAKERTAKKRRAPRASASVQLPIAASPEPAHDDGHDRDGREDREDREDREEQAAE